MTVGACGNGKGKALDTYEANGRAAEYAMVFDAAGEAESTEVGPFVRECIRLGFPVDLIAVHRDYKRAADRVIERAGSSGRIVDLVAFARSHTCGVDNFRALVATDAFVMRSPAALSAFAFSSAAPAAPSSKRR